MTTSGTSGISGQVTRLEAERNRMRVALEEQLAVAERSGRTQMSPSERRALADIRSVEQRLDDLRSKLSRAGVDRLAHLGSSRGADDYAKRARDGAHVAPRLGRQRAAGRHHARAGSQRNTAGWPRWVARRSNSPIRSSAVTDLSTSPPRHSRVCSSMMDTILIGRPSVVASN